MRNAVATVVVVLGSLATLAGCAEPPSKAPATMNVSARLVEQPGGGGEPGSVQTLVMAQVSISDSAGQVMAAPRVLAELGKPATIRVDANGTWYQVELVAARDGDTVRVEADLNGSDGTPLLTVTTQARDEPGEVSGRRDEANRP